MAGQLKDLPAQSFQHISIDRRQPVQVGKQPVKPLCHYVMRQQFYQITGAEDLQGLLEEGGPPIEFLEVVVKVAGVGIEVAHFEEVEVVL